jgi:hypothetical protein
MVGIRAFDRGFVFVLKRFEFFAGVLFPKPSQHRISLKTLPELVECLGFERLASLSRQPDKNRTLFEHPNRSFGTTAGHRRPPSARSRWRRLVRCTRPSIQASTCGTE